MAPQVDEAEVAAPRHPTRVAPHWVPTRQSEILAAACILLLGACAKPNPAYHLDDLDAAGLGDTGRDEPGPGRADIVADVAADLANDGGGPDDDALANGPDVAGPLIDMDGLEPDVSRGADVARPTDVAGSTDVAGPTPGADGPAPACGSERPSLAGITAATGLAIGRDGTIYYTYNSAGQNWLGRLQPGGRPLQPRWISLAMAQVVRGLTIDSNRGTLYLAATGPGAVMAVDVSGLNPPRVVTTAPNTEGIAVGEGGDVYFTEGIRGHVYRISPAGLRTQVSSTTLPRNGATSSAGLAFGLGGSLLVGQRPGPIIRLDLDETTGQEESAVAIAFTGWPYGLAVDNAGRLYAGDPYPGATPGPLRRLDGGGWKALSITGHFGALAFGRGALDCTDLYIADAVGEMRRFATDAPGLPVP